jgi:hypothetical protein
VACFEADEFLVTLVAPSPFGVQAARMAVRGRTTPNRIHRVFIDQRLGIVVRQEKRIDHPNSLGPH